MIKCLTIVDDATHEAVVTEVKRAISSHCVARLLDRLLLSRGLPLLIRSDSGKEVLRQGHAEVGTRPRRGAAPDRTGQAKPERLHRKLQRGLRDECLNEHWFANLLHARAVIEPWRREDNEERPKKVLDGLTPAAYAKEMAKIGHPNPGL